MRILASATTCALLAFLAVATASDAAGTTGSNGLATRKQLSHATVSSNATFKSDVLPDPSDASVSTKRTPDVSTVNPPTPSKEASSDLTKPAALPGNAMLSKDEKSCTWTNTDHSTTSNKMNNSLALGLGKTANSLGMSAGDLLLAVDNKRFDLKTMLNVANEYLPIRKQLEPLWTAFTNSPACRDLFLGRQSVLKVFFVLAAIFFMTAVSHYDAAVSFALSGFLIPFSLAVLSSMFGQDRK